MTQLVSNRDFTLASTLGHAIRFVKGVPTDVPKALVAEAMEKGCVPTQPLEYVEPSADTAPTDQIERDTAIALAFKDIVRRNNISDFSGGGVPTREALKEYLGWEVQAKERSRVWDKIKPEIHAMAGGAEKVEG
jgi:hypothetical protein